MLFRITTGIFIIVSANQSADSNFMEHLFLKLKSNKERSIKENDLRLPPQFRSTSSDESESENDYSSYGKRGENPK